MQQVQLCIVTMLDCLYTEFPSMLNSGPWSYEEIYTLSSIPVCSRISLVLLKQVTWFNITTISQSEVGEPLPWSPPMPLGDYATFAYTAADFSKQIPPSSIHTKTMTVVFRSNTPSLGSPLIHLLLPKPGWWVESLLYMHYWLPRNHWH